MMCPADPSPAGMHFTAGRVPGAGTAPVVLARPHAARQDRHGPRPTPGRGDFIMQDLAALAPPAIVCVAFVIGAWMLLRRELAPKRRARARADARSGDERVPERDERSES
jgi:hypothetical protein